VRTIYASFDEAQVRALLDGYHVRYIYIGNAERKAYGSDAGMLISTIAEQVFAEGDIAIYAYKK
jgi:uncharacterized membrane protein